MPDATEASDNTTELRSFLSKDLFNWLQGGDTLDTCDALLLSASDVFKNSPTDHTPCRPAPPVPRPPIPTPGCASFSSRPFAPVADPGGGPGGLGPPFQDPANI